jgi:hypothetical protein
VKNGSFSMHALTDGGVTVPSKVKGLEWEQFQVVAMDSALVAIGAPEVLPDFKGPAKPQEGFNFCLFNNAWGTNYVQWTPYGRKHGKHNKFRCVFVGSHRQSGALM